MQKEGKGNYEEDSNRFSKQLTCFLPTLRNIYLLEVFIYIYK